MAGLVMVVDALKTGGGGFSSSSAVTGLSYE